MSDSSERANFRLLWVVLVGGVLSLIGGGTLFLLNQSTAGGASGQLGPGRVSETYRVGQRVDIWQNESWLPGTVVAVEGGMYRVDYQRSEVFPAEQVDASRLRPREP